ncbi:MAG: NAD(P)H-hydrate dehydratase [Verrucomicrobiae bacterium]|nr:NAD(P)H-hydrate dehydratase [Verrucomicrobiae bacterium]
MKIVTGSQMREIDARTIKEGGISERTLIERAGRMAAEWVMRRFAAKGLRVVALAGKGHNGADALVAGACLRRAGYAVKTIKAWQKGAMPALTRSLQDDKRVLVLDGLFGIGLNRSIAGESMAMVRAVNSSQAVVVALDIPSGLDADTGEPRSAAVRADYTLTFGLPKRGLVEERAADVVGELHALDIGFPERFVAPAHGCGELLTWEEMADWFPQRSRRAHKGDCGRVLVVGGSVGMAGAPALTARAALRAGAGLVTLVVPQSIYPISAVLAGAEVMTRPCADSGRGFFGATALKELINLAETSDSVVLGMGLGRAPATRKLVEAWVAHGRKPLLVDADGLNLLADLRNGWKCRSDEMVVTPHPGEMARLCGMTVEAVQEDRLGVTADFVRRHQAVTVLKGARTVVGWMDEKAGVRLAVNALVGNPAMATAGSGDVLSGVIAALMARGLKATDAARAGVFLHAVAGDLAVKGNASLIAGDLIDQLPAAVREIEKQRFSFGHKSFHGI